MGETSKIFFGVVPCVQTLTIYIKSIGGEILNLCIGILTNVCHIMLCLILLLVLEVWANLTVLKN